MKFKDFNEASKSGKIFYQLFYYDRTKEYSGYRESENYSTRNEVNARVEELKKINDKMFKDMLNFYGKYGVTEDNYRDYGIWNRLIDNKQLMDSLTKYQRRLFRFDDKSVGYCYIDIYERDLEQERIDEEADYDEDDEYEDGPYGGAFRDQDDYINWKEGPGFVDKGW